MPVKKLKDFLDKNSTKYVVISHSPAYTALEVAASVHIPGKELAKTVMVKIGDKMSMVILPSSYKVNFDLLKKAIGTNKVELATEKEFEIMFPDCEAGAMPPFGNLYNMDVLVDKKLAEEEEIAFNAGSHREVIKLAYRDFEKLAQPKLLELTS